jgi:hypothetical protein
MSRVGNAICLVLLAVSWLVVTSTAAAQSSGNSGTIEGIVTDPSGAVAANAMVEIQNPVSGYVRCTTTNDAGEFRLTNVPFNPYRVSVSLKGFQPFAEEVDVRSLVPVSLNVRLRLAGTSTTVTVEAGGGGLIETEPTTHTDIDRSLFARLPVESSSSSLSSVLTLATPGVAADSNGLFHPLGEHAEVSYSLDGQPITDQQSKVFANQIPVDAIQSMEAVTGISPAEFGDKTSMVVRVVTRSGLGQRQPTGGISAQYGSFGTASGGFNLGLGSEKWGNFLAAGGMNSSRFLDTPEFSPLHAGGNSQNIFDRVDYQLNDKDSLHLNLGFTRSWFQTPNTLDQQAGRQDQRQLLRTFNLAPSWTHLLSQAALVTVDAFLRQDRVNYFPSRDMSADLPATLGQTRRLTNTGFRSDVSYAKGIHNLKAGFEFSYTALSEVFQFGVTDPSFNAVCLNADGSPDTNPTPTDPAQCAGAGLQPNSDFLDGLVPYDLSRGGSLFDFRGTKGIKEVAVYAQDSITLGSWAFNLGLRGDVYRGLSRAQAAQPRVSISYNVKKTNTLLRLGYGRFFETPYNENLILSSTTGAGGLGTGQFGAFGERPIEPGRRNQFTAGFEQALGRYLVVDAEYFWKYTRNAYDFDVLFNTPLAFPVQWRKAKVDGLAVRVNAPEFHGLTAYAVLGHARSRVFGPENGGIIFNSPVDATVFRIDHDQAFQQTTHIQYQPRKSWPWVGLSWRYDSGLVGGEVPDYATALTFTPDQQAAIGLFCGNDFATPSSPITTCPDGVPRGAIRLRIPADGTENDDTNPPRIAPRHLFDIGAGTDNLFHGDRKRWSLRFTVVNLTNKVALYNFLSTFSGTHFVTPRTYTVDLGFHF